MDDRRGEQPPAPVGAAEARSYRRLRIANIAVGAALGCEAIAMLLLSNGLSLPVTASFLRSDPIAAQRAAPTEVLFTIGIGTAVALFLILASIDHLVVAAPRVHRWYEANLARRSN